MRVCLYVAAAILLAACGSRNEPTPADGQTPGATNNAAAGVNAGGASPTSEPASSGAARPAPGLGGGTRELVNPDNNTMVFLYYHLAKLPPPLDNWVEEDNRVRFAPAAEKAGNRTTVRAELESGLAGVKDVGLIRLSMNANLSEYDPTYSEFTIRALAPSSVVEFKAFGQTVSLKFSNGRMAQIWHLPPDAAQAIKDKISYSSRITVDALLRIADVQAGPGGGTLTTEVLEYDLRDDHTGATLVRMGQIKQRP